MDAVWRLLDERAPRRAAHPVRGRARARSSTSTTAPIPSSPPPTPSPARRRPARASARARSATCSASPRPTRRGSARGPFPTELHDETGELIGQRGREFGTVTGRKRRCGWFDATLVRQTVRTSGIDGIALTKLDVLDGFETLRIGVGYRLDGDDARLFPGEPGRAGAASSRFTRRWRAGASRPPAPAPGRTCRRRRSSTCAGSRS